MGKEKCTRSVLASIKSIAGIFLFIGFFLPSSDIFGQCPLNCSDHVYLSLDENCSYDLTPEDVLKNVGPPCDGRYSVELYDKYSNKVTTVSKEHRGHTLIYKAYNENNNTCWGYVTFEDKYAPAIECMDTLVDCWTAETFLDPMIEDNCMYDTYVDEVSRTWVDFNCENPDTFGYIQRSVITRDLWGNTNRCDNQRIYIKRESLDSVVCDTAKVIECCYTKLVDGKEVYVLWDPNYVYEDEYGYSHPIPKPGGLTEPPYITGGAKPHWLTPNSNNKGKCNIVTTYKDHVIPTCGYSYKIRREWKIFDWCTAQETLCVQWIKIIDTTAPQIKVPNVSNPYKDICLDGRDYEWYGDECDAVQAVNVSTGRTFTVQSHDCKAHVTLKRPEIEKECGFLFAKGDADKLAEAHRKIKVSYLIRYKDYWTEDHKEKVLTGDIPYGEEAHVYLPSGWFTVIYFVKDECWNEAWACEEILVHDNIPPTPVCDEITQVTLDPDKCWTRVFAEDLDDGSNDNCSHKLHFAVASMDTIEYYRNKWKEELIDCYDAYTFDHHYDLFHELIEEWINCYVFDDYVDLTECGTEQLVLRVYEADGLPLYDPHIFKGSRHQWFCYNLYDDYACWLGWNYDKLSHYENPVPDLCNDYDLIEGEGGYYLKHKKVADYHWNCFGPCGDNLVAASFLGSASKGAHGPQPNYVCCTYMESGNKDYPAWMDLVDKYPELSQLNCKRYEFPHLYNDCMIEVIKDDKTPPVCHAPENVTYYCDGVPYHGIIYPNGGNNGFEWWGARFAHDICEGSDTWDANCIWDRTDDASGNYSAPGVWCVKPGWNNEHGYYMGPSSDSYHYEDPCNDHLLEWYPEADDWKPVYCRFWLMLDVFDDPGYGKPNPDKYFGTPEYYDNCWYPDIDSTTEGSLDECGVGKLTRTWTVTDKCGNTSSCYQTVTIKPRSDFEVKFPADIVVNCDDSVSLDPDKTNPDLYPQIKDDDCELIGITYSDQVIDIFEDGCYKILRTWKVIDWCVFVPDIHSRYPDVIVDDRIVADPDERPCVYRCLKDDGDGFMTYLQVIKIVDEVAPEVVCSPDSVFCIYDENCEDLYVEYDLGSATDNCTEGLRYRYTINPNGDSEESDWIFGHGTILQNTLPVGEHLVTLYAADDCGNEGYCQLTVTVRDCKPPTPYCYNGIATVVMPSTNEVTVWAIDLDAGSFDNCTEQENLRFTFSDVHPDEDDTYSEEDRSSSMVFTCDQLGQVEVTVYVWDESDNVDFCVTYLLIQPGDAACDGASLASISGELMTEMIDAVEFAKVELSSDAGSGSEIVTGVDGQYTFSNLQTNKSYTVSPIRDDEHDNGVSTLDLVLIQKHILGIDMLDSPYKVIAADINNSEGITALDLVELRRLILGVFEEFPNNSSWRFVPESHTFDDPQSPWGFPESFDIDNMTPGNILADFVGIKIGDVNATVKSHSLFGSSVRNAGNALVFQTVDQQVTAGSEVTVTMRADNFENISGYQFTLMTDGLILSDIESNSIEVSSDNFGIHKGAITTSWNSASPLTQSSDLFSLSFVASKSGKLSDLISVKSNITNAEAYNGSEILDVKLEFVNENNQVIAGDYRLLQNTPNPFDQETLIGFVLPKAGPATLQILDVQGKVVKTVEGDYNKGLNQIRIAKKDLSADGVLYYKLSSGEFIATKKMILIR